jgi:rRNA-processing protein EBP2
MGKSKKSEKKAVGKEKDPRPTASPSQKKVKLADPLSSRSSRSSNPRPRITLQDVLGENKTKRENSKDRNDASSDEDASPSSSSSNSSEMPPESEWDEPALALKQMIEGGAFDHLLEKKRQPKDQGSGDEDSASSIEEVDLKDDDDEEEEDEQQSEPESADEGDEDRAVCDLVDDEAESASEGSNDLKEEEMERCDDDVDEDGEDDVESDEESVDDEDMDRESRLSKQNHINSKALQVVTESLRSPKLGWPWAETFDVVSSDPLPFDKTVADDRATVDIHDDLKREVAFYDMALAAVAQARERCSIAKIEFSRPEDFFAEMVKTDGTSEMCKRATLGFGVLLLSSLNPRLSCFLCRLQVTWPR